MDVLLIGFGAVGAMYSLVLHRSGRVRITIVARSNCETIKAHGVNYKSAKYGEIHGWKPDRVCASVTEAADRPYAYAVVTTKAIPELLRTPALVAPLLSPQYLDQHPLPTFVLMQNGINVEVDLYQALKILKPEEEPTIISAAVWTAAGMHGGNTVEHNEIDRASLGIYRPSSDVTTNSPREVALLSDFACLLTGGGSEAVVVPEIQRIKFTKNIWNACFGVMAAITRLSSDAIFRPPPAGIISSTIMTAGPAAASAGTTAALPAASTAIAANTVPMIYDAMTEIAALGAVPFPPSDASGEGGLVPDIALNTLTFTADLYGKGSFAHRASTLVDVELGRPTEVEAILGELVRMARRHAVPVPRLETMYALMLIIQNQLLQQHYEKASAHAITDMPQLRQK